MQYPRMPTSAEQRQNEFSDALLRNIFQDNVGSVTVLVERETDMAPFTRFVEHNAFLNFGTSEPGVTNWDNDAQKAYFYAGVPDALEDKKAIIREKLKVVVLGRWMLYKDAFQYASQHLQGRYFSNYSLFIFTFIYVFFFCTTRFLFYVTKIN